MAWRRIGAEPLSWTNADLVQGNIYPALGGDELMAYHGSTCMMVLNNICVEFHVFSVT